MTQSVCLSVCLSAGRCVSIVRLGCLPSLALARRKATSTLNAHSVNRISPILLLTSVRKMPVCRSGVAADQKARPARASAPAEPFTRCPPPPPPPRYRFRVDSSSDALHNDSCLPSGACKSPITNVGVERHCRARHLRLIFTVSRAVIATLLSWPSASARSKTVICGSFVLIASFRGLPPTTIKSPHTWQIDTSPCQFLLIIRYIQLYSPFMI